GLDCGISFAKERLKLLPPGSQIALVPCAVGGSSIKQWLYDSLYRNNKLYSNILRKSKLAPKIDGVLWMQGENDANDAMHAEFPLYAVPFFDQLRSNLNCPIHVALLPSFQGPYSDSINNHLKKIPGLNLINTSDLNHKGDTLHFDSNSQRILGARFAESVQHTLSDIK
ncbi:MAG: hypothetical protein J7578_23530, partial [Chitinophagaceae bacterium]|nr:hypothetical protein [Chitinophagaceae bacterium]